MHEQLEIDFPVIQDTDFPTTMAGWIRYFDEGNLQWKAQRDAKRQEREDAKK